MNFCCLKCRKVPDSADDEKVSHVFQSTLFVMNVCFLISSNMKCGSLIIIMYIEYLFDAGLNENVKNLMKIQFK